MTGGIVRPRLSLSERLYRRFFHKFHGRDIYGALQLRARDEALDYIAAHMGDALMFRDRWAQLAHGLKLAPGEGLILEFGVQDGASLNHLAALAQSRIVHGFDSFEGLPEDWTGTFEARGKFSRGGAPPEIRDNARLHVGWFDKTLPGFLQQQEDKVALLHVDCDLYASTRIVLHALADRLVAGSVIIFDEYFNYPNWRAHEYRAFQEWVSAHDRRYAYRGFTAVNGHVMVQLLA